MESGKLIKLLQLSQSPNDYEALAAIRRANTLLQKENLDWQAFFSKMLPDRQPSVIISFTCSTPHFSQTSGSWQTF